MFNIGTGELLMIVVVALLVFGPNRLPEIMRNVGKAYRAFQAESQKAASVLRDGLDEPASSPQQASTPNLPGVLDRADDGAAVPPVYPAAAAPVAASPTTPEPLVPVPPEIRRYEDT